MSKREGNEPTQPVAVPRYDMPGRYEIQIKGHLDARWSAWFDGMELRRENNATTTLEGQVADQAALHGLLQKVRDLGLTLISVMLLKSD